jgi:hypothetical protein
MSDDVPSSFSDSPSADLADLVDFPRETLDIELKGWMDLDNRLAQAKLARHIAALANHGGGYLVFGFEDDGTRCPERPTDLGAFNRDRFASIVRRYLTPAFQCDVTLAVANDGVSFPIVRVPSHGAVPVAAKADGPHEGRQGPQGITSGAHYIRKPGPESAPVITAEEWRPLIRRCVLNDRDQLLSEIAIAVQPGTRAVEPAAEDRLKNWHEQSEHNYLAILERAYPVAWPVDLVGNRCQLSYLIISDGKEAIPGGKLREVLEEINHGVRQTVWTGWSMFFPFTRPEIAASLHPEFADGMGAEVLETDLVSGELQAGLPDYWRVAADGRATIFRPYREDETSKRPPGSWLSPETVIRETAELVTHARLLAERFDTAIAITFRCSWLGLAGREIDDFGSAYWSPGRIAKADQRTTTGTWALPALAASWHSAVAQLACPVLALFGFNDCGAELVQGLQPRFIKLGPND